METGDIAANEQRVGRSDLAAELDQLISKFEAETLALPPSEAALRQWTQKALGLGKRVRESDFNGKGSLRRRLQRFHLQLRLIRVARRRFVAQRDLMSSLASQEVEWLDQSVGLPRHPLADAIHIFVENCVPDTEEASEDVLDINQRLVSELASDIQVVEPSQPYLASPSINAPKSPLSKQLASPTPARFRTIRPGATRVDPIMAIEGRLALTGHFEKARETAIAWLKKKGMNVSPEAINGFEVESKDKKNRAIAVAWNRMWALQVETTDTHVAERRWRVEMVLVDAEPTAGVGVRLTAISPAHEAPPPPSIPGLVSALIQNIGLLDSEVNEQLFSGATAIETPRALQELLTSLQSDRRRRPAIVMSQYQKGDRTATLMDPASLAERLRGVARVYVVSREMSWGMTRALTKRFSVGGASIRLFRPGFSLDDDPNLHPKWDPTALKEQDITLSGLTSIFLREAADASIQALERDDSVLPFDRIREKVLRRQIDEARDLAKVASKDARSETEFQAAQNQLKDESALRELFEDENNTLVQELQSLRQDRDKLREELQKLKAANHFLRNRVAQPQKTDVVVEPEPHFPDDWNELEEWCESNLVPGVYVSSKAVKAARDSVFENIPFAYQVLHFLANTYAPYRRGDLGSEKFEQERSKLGIIISPVGRGSEDRKSKPTYSTMFNQERLSLDMHVKGSDDKNPRFGFRLYFHWHEEDHCVVVGSFPTHLRNSLTN